jgi:hypothetical protein
MNEHFQHEHDDELLSAYLDDELSPEDRALVESRLATDPAARQMLEQLRHVSQSVHDLPHEPAPDYLRDTILRRIETSRTASTESTLDAFTSPQSPAPSPLPSIPVGRTMRGWVWAAVAIAAALLIMFMQPGMERQDVPDVAERAGESRDKLRSLDRDSNLADTTRVTPPTAGRLPEAVSVPAPSTSSAPAPTTPSAPPSSMSRSEDLSGGPSIAARESQPQSADGAAGSLEGTATDRFAQAETEAPSAAFKSLEQSQATTAEAAVQPAPAVDDPKLIREQSLPAEPTPPVIVNVLAKRSAIEKNSFAGLLNKHGVAFVEPTSAVRELGEETEEATALAAGTTPSQAESAPAEAEGREFNVLNDAKGLELVLVEAPTDTVESFMDDLKSDTNNYLGIEVVDGPTSGDSTAQVKSEPHKLGIGWQRFNRGTVPQLQAGLNKEKAASRYDFQPLPATESRSGDAPQAAQEFRAGGFGGVAASQSNGARTPQGSARRLAPTSIGGAEHYGLATRDGLDLKRAPSDDIDAHSLYFDVPLAKSPANDPGRMQVLFVIQPGDESPAPATKAP